MAALCRLAALVLLAAVLLPAARGADEELSRCARLEKAHERLACYDELARTTTSLVCGTLRPEAPRKMSVSETCKETL